MDMHGVSLVPVFALMTIAMTAIQKHGDAIVGGGSSLLKTVVPEIILGGGCHRNF